MKAIKINGKALLAALDLVGSGFSATTLTRVTLGAGEDGVGDCKIEVWDLEAMARTSMPFSNEGPANLAILVPSAQLETLITKTGAEEISISDSEKKVTLKAKTTKLAVGKIDETTMRTWNVIEPTTHIEISKASLLGSLAAPIEDILGTGSQIRGFQVSAANGEVCLLATDGFRIYRAVIKDTGIVQAEEGKAVLPVKVLKFLKRLDDSEMPMSLGFEDDSYLLRAGLGELTLELNGSSLKREIPDITQLLNGKPDHRFLVSIPRFKAEVDLHNSLSADKVSAGVFEFKEGSLDMDTRDSKNINQITSKIEVGDEYQVLERTTDIKLALRLKYLSEALKFMEVFEHGKGAMVEIGIATGSTGLLWIQPSQSTRDAHGDSEILCVIAPINQ